MEKLVEAKTQIELLLTDYLQTIQLGFLILDLFV